MPPCPIPSFIEQTVTVEVGRSYTLRFLVAERPGVTEAEQVSVLINDNVVLENFNPPEHFTTKTVSFVGPNSGQGNKLVAVSVMVGGVCVCVCVCVWREAPPPAAPRACVFFGVAVSTTCPPTPPILSASCRLQ